MFVSNTENIKSEEVEDIVNLQSRLEKQHEELKDEFRQLSEIREEINPEQIKLLKKEIEDSKKNFKKLKLDEVGDVVNFQIRLERIHEELKDDFRRVVDRMEEFKTQMDTFDDKIEHIKKIEDHIRKLDMKQMRREIEILKTKDHWIMDNLEKLDIDPLFEKIQEMQHEIRTVKATLPFVIE